MASGKDPLPFRGLPLAIRCLVAYTVAARPVPGASGGAPQTVGPVLIPGIYIRQSSKYSLKTSNALALLQRRSLEAPLILRLLAVCRNSFRETPVFAISIAKFATGIASFRYLL